MECMRATQRGRRRLVVWPRLCWVLLLGLLTASAARGQALPYFVVHEAGAPGGAGTNGGTGATARFCGPAGVAADGKGAIFVADAGSSTIRKVTTAGVVSLLAGRAGIPGRVDDSGQTAAFDTPLGIAVDASGFVWVADTGNHTIRKVTAGGAVTTLAGGGGQPGSTDATGTAARFRSPSAIVADASGTLYVADTGNHAVRRSPRPASSRRSPERPARPGWVDGTGGAARFSSPAGIAIDRAGNLWVADTGNHVIRRVTAAGAVTTLAGRAGVSGSSDGAAGVATFAWPAGIAVDRDGNLYVTDTPSHVLRSITPQGVVTTIAGAVDQPGSDDGTHAGARFFAPIGVTF